MAIKKTVATEKEVSKKKSAGRSSNKQQGAATKAEPINESSRKSKSQASNADVRVNLGDIIHGFATSSSRVVQKAASILEEEIAAGIVAAKEVESKFINVKKIRSRQNDEIIQRYRRDSHEIVDILLDLLDVSVKNAGSIAEKIINVRGFSSKKNAESDAGDIPLLNMPSPLAPGSHGTISMLFENSQNKATGIFKVACTDLLSSTGGTIPASSIKFSPVTINIAPQAQQEIGVTVEVPLKAKPGVYSGLIQATNIEQLRAVLIVTVQ